MNDIKALFINSSLQSFHSHVAIPTHSGKLKSLQLEVAKLQSFSVYVNTSTKRLAKWKALYFLEFSFINAKQNVKGNNKTCNKEFIRAEFQWKWTCNDVRGDVQHVKTVFSEILSAFCPPPLSAFIPHYKCIYHKKLIFSAVHFSMRENSFAYARQHAGAEKKLINFQQRSCVWRWNYIATVWMLHMD